MSMKGIENLVNLMQMEFVAVCASKGWSDGVKNMSEYISLRTSTEKKKNHSDQIEKYLLVVCSVWFCVCINPDVKLRKMFS